MLLIKHLDMRMELIMLLCVEKMLQDILIMRRVVYLLKRFMKHMYSALFFQEMKMEI